jgi:hypothetical protein
VSKTTQREETTVSTFIARQGDVLIARVKHLPRGAQPVDREHGRLVLAHGEVTGHAHVVVGEAELFTAADIADLETRFLRVEADSQVVHDEHTTIALSPGIYEVRRQREYTPEAIRNVAD